MDRCSTQKNGSPRRTRYRAHRLPCRSIRMRPNRAILLGGENRTTLMILPNAERSRSGDLSSLRQYCSFHVGLSLQAFEISRDGYSSENATAFLVCHGTIARIEAPIDLDSLPLLRVAHVIDSHIVVLTPKEWNSVKLFAMAKNILCRYLPLALSH